MLRAHSAFCTLHQILRILGMQTNGRRVGALYMDLSTVLRISAWRSSKLIVPVGFASLRIRCRSCSLNSSALLGLEDAAARLAIALAGALLHGPHQATFRSDGGCILDAVVSATSFCVNVCRATGAARMQSVRGRVRAHLAALSSDAPSIRPLMTWCDSLMRGSVRESGVAVRPDI